MKAKTIKSVLRRKVDAWLKTITCEETRKLASENVIITGGAIASMLLKEKVNDYDVYFRTGEAAFAVAQYYVNKFNENPPKSLAEHQIYLANENKERVSTWDGGRIRIVVKSAGISGEEDDVEQDYDYFESGDESGDRAEASIDQACDVAEQAETKEATDYRPVFLSSNAITLSGSIQLVVRFFGEPDQIHENYDFVHCTNYWCSWDRQLVLKPEALEALLARELRYIGSLYPLCSVIRTRKFINRGWSINAGQYLKMLMQVSDLDLKDIDVLEDQLIGVDTAYFVELIDKLRSHMKETGAKQIDRTYLAQVIDRIF